jgi:oligopeptide/dipeptide ABC transporter ATP-binding protein
VNGPCEGRDVTVGTVGGGVQLVEGVDLAVEAGAMLGIVGETGAGKTVTMRALLGLLPPGVRAHGELRVNGDVVSLARVGELRRLLGSETSVVLQNPVGMLDPMVRVGDQLVEGVVRKGVLRPADARARAVSLLGQMGFRAVEHVLTLYPFQLSGGMAQRVTIAMGMMPGPRLLVVDEPTSALDANVRLEVLRLFKRLAQEEGTAVILVSHDLGLVSHFCDTIAVMYAGRVVEHGPTRELVARPAHPYTVALLDASATLTARRRVPLRVLPGAPPRPGHWPAGCVFAPRCPHAQERCVAERPLPTADGSRGWACHFPRIEQA